MWQEPERQPGTDEPFTPREARVKWLQREMHALQAMLEDKHGKPAGTPASYWDTPFETQEQRMNKMFQKLGQRGGGVLEDCVRSFPIALPRLSGMEIFENAALQAGDWLAQIRPPHRRHINESGSVVGSASWNAR